MYHSSESHRRDESETRGRSIDSVILAEVGILPLCHPRGGGDLPIIQTTPPSAPLKRGIMQCVYFIPKQSIIARQLKIVIKNCPTRNYMS